MSVTNNKAKASPDKLFALLFDEGIYTELLPAASCDSTDAMAVCGKVSGQNVYAFAQSDEGAGGAMSTLQAQKLLKLYALALKTGYPVVGFYTNSSAKISEGNMLLDALGDLLASSKRLSGVVPRISVVLGDCVASTAMMASSADFVIMTEDAKLTLSADCDCSGKDKAAVIAKDASDAVEKAVELLTYLPANNLCVAPAADYADGEIFDADSELELYSATENSVSVSFARLSGKVVGSIKVQGEEIDKKGAKKIASFVRFCDAFSLPVITFVDAKSFCCLGSANSVLSAYAESTTVKISVINGTAVGPVYMALAGKAGRNDAVIGMVGATVSPINPKAVAYLALGDNLSGTVSVQDAIIEEYIRENLSAENAAKQGFVDDIADSTTLRTKLINYLDILSSKRESTLPKKHSTI